MKKIVSIALVMILALSFAACSQDSSSDESVSADLVAIKTEMIQTLSPADPIELDASALLNLYGIAAEDVAECASYTTMGGVFPEEVIMLKAVDSDALARIEEKMNARIDSVKVQAQSYDAENYAIAQKSEVQKKGDYIAMFLSPDYDVLVGIFNSAF